MMANKVFLIPVLDLWVVYAPTKNIAALVNQSAVDRVRRTSTGDIPGPLEDFFLLLKKTPANLPKPLEGEVCPSFLGIIPTRGCNISCAYCNFGSTINKMPHMKPEIAVAALDWMAERLESFGQKAFNIHFFGGEPFVAPKIVDLIVHRARHISAERGLVPYFEASTNGIFDESRCQFIGDYFDSVVLSFDGPAKFHDKNRPGIRGCTTSAIVGRTAKRLSEMPIDLCIRICVTQDSVHSMEEITQWMCEEFSPSILNFETLTPGEMAIQSGLKGPDPYDFAVHCVGSFKLADELGIKAVYSASENQGTRLSFCPLGTDAIIVSPEGRMSGCYLMSEDWKKRGLDLDIGWVEMDGSVDADMEAIRTVRRLPMNKPRCEDCFCRWSCAGGCHVNQTYPECDLAYSDFCIQTRIITVAKILSGLNCDDLVDDLLRDRVAMEALAEHRSDHIEVN